MAKFQEIVQQAAFRSMNLHSTATAKARVKGLFGCGGQVLHVWVFLRHHHKVRVVVYRSIIGRLCKANPTNGTQKCEHFWRLFWTLEHNEVPHCAEASNESFQIHQAHYTLIDLFVNGEGTLHQLHKRRKMKVFDAPSLRKTLQQQQQKRQTPYKKS